MESIKKTFSRALLFALLCCQGLAIDEMISAPSIGQDFDEAHTAETALIIEVDGTQRDDFPQNGFVIPLNTVVRFKATRATCDWDTHRLGDPCNMELLPVQDTLRVDRPRWQCAVGEFVGGDISVEVLWKAPESPGLLPGVPMKLFEDDMVSYNGQDDGGPENPYGILQDSVLVRAYEFAELSIISSGAVSHDTVGFYANAYDIHELWWRGSYDHWLEANTFNGIQFIDTDKNGTSLLYGEHPHATGTRLKTEVQVKIYKHPGLPANILAALEDGGNWSVGQDTRYGLFRNGVPFPESGEYWDEWRQDGPSDASDDLTRSLLFGWIYYGDAPGTAMHPPNSNGQIVEFQDLLNVGDILDFKPSFRVRVRFRHNGSRDYVTAAEYTYWEEHNTLVWSQTDPDIYEVTNPAHREF